MFNMKRILHLMLAVVMLLTCFQIPYAYAADDPVTVTLEGTMQPIPAAAIVLCDAVKARSVTITDSNGDSVTVPLSTALTPGERVIMMRCAHGQRFVVLSRG